MIPSALVGCPLTFTFTKSFDLYLTRQILPHSHLGTTNPEVL